MKLVIYTRRSTDRQSASPHTQESLCRQWAEENGHEITQIFHEVAISGKTEIERRTALPELIAAVKDRKGRDFDGVIVWRTDRLCRNPAEWHRILSIFDKARCQLFSVKDPIRRDTAADRLMSSIMADAAAYEREVTGERIYAHHLAKHLQAKWTGGQVSMGFHWDKTKQIFTLTDRAQDVVAVFEAYVAANGNALSAAKILNQAGVRSPRGQNWCNNMVLSTVKRPMYRRKMTFDGREIDASRIVPESVPADLIAQVDLLIEANKREQRTIRQVGSSRPYSGILYCSECGSKLTANYRPYRGKSYGTWVCSLRRSSLCESHYVSDSFIDQMISEALLICFSRFQSTIETAQKGQRTPKHADLHAKQIQRFQRQRELIIDTYADGYISKEEFVKRITKIDQDIADAKAKRVQHPEPAIVSDGLLQAVNSLATSWPDVPEDEKRGLLMQIGANVVLNTSGTKPFWIDFTSTVIPGTIRTQHNGRWAKKQE